jgi:hypothetical protein
MIAWRARISGASDGQIWRALGGESATGDRQNIAEGTGGETGASVAHPARINVHITDTRHGFIAAQTPVCRRINQVSKRKAMIGFAGSRRSMSSSPSRTARERNGFPTGYCSILTF